MADKQVEIATELLSFNKMLTPRIIVAVYYLALLSVVVGSLGLMFNEQVMAGIAVLIVGALAARISCELLIVTFKINEALQEIRFSGRGRALLNDASVM